MDRQDQTETRDPDKPAHRHGLRHALRRAAAGRRAGLRSDVVGRLQRHGRRRAHGAGKVDFYRSGVAVGSTIDQFSLGTMGLYETFTNTDYANPQYEVA